MTTAPTELKPSAPAVGGVRVKPLGMAAMLSRNAGNTEGAPEWIRVAQDGEGMHGGFWTCAAATEDSPQYIRADLVRKALEPQAVDDAMVWQPIETAPKDGTVVLAVTVEAQNPKARLAWFEGEGWVRIWKSEDFVVDGPR